MLTPDSLQQLVSGASFLDALARYLRACRWFGGKERRIEGITIEDVLVPDGEKAPGFVALVRCQFEDNSIELYLVAFAAAAPGTAVRAGLPALAGRALTEAFEVADFARHLVAVAAGEATLRGRRGDVTGTPLATLARFPPARRRAWTPVPLDADQSNSALRCGDDAVLKVYRRLDAGIHPDVEVSEYLTRISFPHTPPLLGWFAYRARDTGASIALGTLQALVPDSVTAWQHFSVRLEALLGVESDGGAASEAEELLAVDERDAEALGRRTAALHAALGAEARDPAFLPEALDPPAFRSWVAHLENEREAVTALLARERREAPGRPLPAARRFVAASAALGERLRSLGATVPAASCSRVHGDYHLGQVLRAGGDFWIIDFEGEPLRPLAERRTKKSPLCDVAGMVRSFHYAAASASRGRGDGPPAQRASDWRARMTGAFLRGYRRESRDTPLVPAGDAFDRLLALYVIEKALYEVRYELEYRPDWLEIPLAGLVEECGRS